MSQIQLNIPPPPPSNPSSHGAVEYDLHMRQEPKQARMCGVGGKADRRPIDPPPIIQLVVRPTSNKANTSPEGSLGFLQNPYYFMFASLAKPDDDTELHWLKDGRTRCTQGSVVSSLYHLKDRNNEDVGFFVFPDVSVRTEGSYRLKLSLFEVAGNMVRHCKSIFSKPFYVYTAKKFPGMEQSTELSCSLADQGIKIRIRKDIRVRGPKEPDRKRQRQDNNDHDQSVILTSTSTLQDTPSASSASIPPPPGAQLAIPPPSGAQGIPPPPGAAQSIPPPPGAQTIQPPPGAQAIPASHGSSFPSPSSPAPVSVAGAQGPPPPPHVSMPPPSHVPMHPSGHPPQEYYPHPYDHHYYSTMWHYPSYPPPTPHEGYPPPSHPAGPGHQRPPAPGYPPPPPPYYYPHPSHPHSAWGTPPGWVPPPGDYPPRGDYGQQPQRDYAPPPREYAPPGRPADYVPPRTNEYSPPGRPIDYPPRTAPTEYSRSLEYGSPHARPGDYPQREYQRDYTPATSQPPTPHSHHIPPPPGAQRLGVDNSYVPRDSYAQASQRDYTPISREYSSQQTAHSNRSEYSPREYSPEPASRREYIPAISSHRTSAEYGRSSVSGYPSTNGPYSASSTGSYGPSSAYGPPSSSSSGSFPPSSAASSGSFPSAYPISPVLSPTIQGNKLSIGSILRKERD